jgi:hypothetical protein
MGADNIAISSHNNNSFRYAYEKDSRRITFDSFLTSLNDFIKLNRESISESILDSENFISNIDKLNLEGLEKDFIIEFKFFFTNKPTIIKDYIGQYVDFVLDQKQLYFSNEYSVISTKRSMFDFSPKKFR